MVYPNFVQIWGGGGIDGQILQMKVLSTIMGGCSQWTHNHISGCRFQAWIYFQSPPPPSISNGPSLCQCKFLLIADSAATLSHQTQIQRIPFFTVFTRDSHPRITYIISQAKPASKMSVFDVWHIVTSENITVSNQDEMSFCISSFSFTLGSSILHIVICSHAA